VTTSERVPGRRLQRGCQKVLGFRNTSSCKMRVVARNEGFITNCEVLLLLRQRTQELPQEPLYPQPHDPFVTELQCYESLNSGKANLQGPKKLREFLKSIEPVALTHAECIQLINLKPLNAVDIHLVSAYLPVFLELMFVCTFVMTGFFPLLEQVG